MPASKVLHYSTDGAESSFRIKKATCYAVRAYQFYSKAHEFCYPAVDFYSRPFQPFR
jgi:hypothetical protein